MITVSSLHIYPVKSTTGLSLTRSAVGARGLDHDRRYAIVDPDGQIITAREAPHLLGLKAAIEEGSVVLIDTKTREAIRLGQGIGEAQRVGVFDRETTGKGSTEDVDAWLSAYLGRPCRLVFMDDTIRRPVLERHGGEPNDEVSYADQCPILLISEASLADLNSRLDAPVSMQHFRPNIVVKGCDAFAEDTWQHVEINGIPFRVSQRCERCVFTTIDPETYVPHKRQEPLRTLATYRRLPKGGVGFGVHLVPLGAGEIVVGEGVSFE
ncbi:MAG: MOSC N-terminal beta barrel domain-containing protein [Bacteroidota bacterium]